MAHDHETTFIEDMKGVYEQHAAMWTVYTESIRLLVTVTSLPLLVVSAVLALEKDGQHINLTDIGSLPPALAWVLLLTPLIDLLLLGAVIHHRLVILFYARALNGFRKVYFREWNQVRSTASASQLNSPMPTDPTYPRGNYEPRGPMGLIVHGCALVNAVYLFIAVSYFSECKAAAFAISVGLIAAYEVWYWINSKRGAR